MQTLLQERERLAMIVEDQASYLAQRHWVGSLQVPRVPGPPMTWQAAYEHRHEDLGHAHGAMRVALQAHRHGDYELAEQVLRGEVGSDSETEAEEMIEAEATGVCRLLQARERRRRTWRKTWKSHHRNIAWINACAR